MVGFSIEICNKTQSLYLQTLQRCVEHITRVWVINELNPKQVKLMVKLFKVDLTSYVHILVDLIDILPF